MPVQAFHFCRECLSTQETASGQICGVCGGKLLPLLDESGAISRDFLESRGTCCSNGCRNCPYGDSSTASATTKTCPRCGNNFACRGEDCWCAGVQLDANSLRALEHRYEGCLCPECLGTGADSLS